MSRHALSSHWRGLRMKVARARASGGIGAWANSILAAVGVAAQTLLIASCVVVLFPVFAMCNALGPAQRCAKKTKLWREAAHVANRWERAIEARMALEVKRSSARSWRMGRRMARRLLMRAASENEGARRWAWGLAMALCWLACAARAAALIMICGAFALFLAPVMVAMGVEEMGIDRAEERFTAAFKLPGLALGLAMFVLLARGPLGALWTWQSGMSRAAGLAARRMPDAWAGRRGSLLGINAFVLASRASRRGSGRSFGAARRPELSAGRSEEYELWLDPRLALQALDPVGLLGGLLGGFENGPRWLSSRPVDAIAKEASDDRWGDDDPRLQWLRWAQAMGEARALGEASVGADPGLALVDGVARRARRL